MDVHADDLLARCKRSTLIRWAVSPYKNWRIKSLYQEYLRSEDCRRLTELRDTHRGERCFIIGNGSSLRAEDLEKLTGEFTFGANRIYEIFDQTTWRPSVYLAIDEDFLRSEYDDVTTHMSHTLKLLPFKWFAWRGKLREGLDENAVLIWVGPKKFDIKRPEPWAERSAHIPDDVARGFAEGRTITFEAIQMAIHMGFSEIYLLGVDFNYSRVIDENGIIRNVDGVTTYFSHKDYSTSLLYYVPTKWAYEVSREYCDAHGITIRNATRGGKLEAFERVDLDEVLK